MPLPTHFFSMRGLRQLGLTLALGAATLSSSPALAAPPAKSYAEVQRLIGVGQAAEALRRADAYIASNPSDPQMRFLKSSALNASGRPDDAVEVLRALINDYPELPEPYNNLAVILASQGNYEDARAALELAVRADPNYAEAYENLGDIHARLASQNYALSAKAKPANPRLPAKQRLLAQVMNDGKPVKPAARGASMPASDAASGARSAAVLPPASASATELAPAPALPSNRPAKR